MEIITAGAVIAAVIIAVFIIQTSGYKKAIEQRIRSSYGSSERTGADVSERCSTASGYLALSASRRR